jgi:hypothetical protein
MHDPMTVAFEINMPFTGKKDKKGNYVHYPKTLAVIWHVDPQTDGSDDSCGWFMRTRHGNKETFEVIKREFEFEWKYLFDADGKPLFSAQAITLILFRRAAYEHFGHDWHKVDRWIKSNLPDLILFAENPIDSLNGAIHREKNEDSVNDFSHVIYGYLLRSTRPWWKSPRWHVHHWEIQIPFMQNLKRFLFGRCAGCGKGFRWGESVHSTQWDGGGPQWFRSERGIYHGGCVGSALPFPVRPIKKLER